jgi:hypothetical protein
MELFPKKFVLELNTKNFGNSTSFLTITYMTLSAKRFKNTEFSRSMSLLYSVSGQNSGGMDLQFPDSDWPKLQKSKYRFRRKLSKLSDGPINGSNWLVICMLRQSETRPDAEIIFLADPTFLYKTGSW